MAANKADNIYCDRRPMTRKEIKFFGTAISFDEEMAAAMAAKGITTTPKFFRTQSSSMLSPKTGRKFFRGRDKNSNYDYGSASVGTTPKSSIENLCNRGRSITKLGGSATIVSGRQMLGTLKLVQESTEVDNCSAEDNDSVFVGVQRIEKRNRLIQMRMTRLRSRSASTDSWDDPNDRR